MNGSRRGRWRGNRHPAWWAFAMHRLSGLALALFLPVHFSMLSLAIRDAAVFDRFTRWTEQPLVKLAEALLVALLALHLAGGLRLLALEFLPWRDWQKTLAALSFAAAFAVGLGFAFAA